MNNEPVKQTFDDDSVWEQEDEILLNEKIIGQKVISVTGSQTEKESGVRITFENGYSVLVGWSGNDYSFGYLEVHKPGRTSKHEPPFEVIHD